MANENAGIAPKENAAPAAQATQPVTPPLTPKVEDLPKGAEPAMESQEETMELPPDPDAPENPPSEPEAGSSQIAEEVAPEVPKQKIEGTDDILEQLRGDTDRIDQAPEDTDIDMETNQVLTGVATQEELQAFLLKNYQTLQSYRAAKDDPESLLNRAISAYNHGWGTTSASDLTDVLMVEALYKKLGNQRDTDRFPGLKDGHPSRVTHKSVDVAGQEAVLAFKARLGGLVRVNLLNSGFWVAVRSPQLDELQEIFATIDFENKEIGRILGGHFALVTDMYLKRKFVEILIQKRLIVESNFKDVFKAGAFVRNLAFHDYDTLLHAIVMLMTRGGLRYRCICPKCGHVSTETLDVSACKFVNEDLWTDEVRTWWNTTRDTDGKLLKHTEKDLLEYRTKILGRKTTYTQYIENGFNEKVQIDIEMSEPTMQKFFEIGDTLIHNLNETIDHISTGETDKAEMVRNSLAIHSYQLIAPWVDTIKLYKTDGSVEIQTSDPKAILSHLDESIAKDDKIFETLTKFIAASRFNYIGTHSIRCPQCQATPNTKMDNFYPLEIQTIFFGLLSRLWLAGR